MSLLFPDRKAFVTTSGLSAHRLNDNTIHLFLQCYVAALNNEDNMVEPPSASEGVLGISFEVPILHTDTALSIKLKIINQVALQLNDPSINTVFLF